MMTTTQDHGSNAIDMIRCELDGSNNYATIDLAVRDMRLANGRDSVTGDGDSNESWVGLVLGMIVLNAVARGTGNDLRGLLVEHGVPDGDASVIYELGGSLLSSYELPKRHAVRLYLTDEQDAFAVDRTREAKIVISVPVFCSRLVERIVSETREEWDGPTVNTGADYT